MENGKLTKVVRARLSERDVELAREVLEKRETLSELVRTATRRLVQQRLVSNDYSEALRRLVREDGDD